VASEKVVGLWMVEKLLLVVGREKGESRLVEQLWLLENLMSAGPTCQPPNTFLFSFAARLFLKRSGEGHLGYPD
jgi:hypothetical protein